MRAAKESENIIFTSALTKKEEIAAAFGLLLHIGVVPRIALTAVRAGLVSDELGSFLQYAVMALYVLLLFFTFLRRDFDPLADAPFQVALEVLFDYFALLFFNGALAYVLVLLDRIENPNNAAVMEMAAASGGLTKAMTVFLAPIVEEVLFRGFLFGSVRKKNRIAAYIVCTLCFSLYHLFGYILLDPANTIYLIQYLPATLLLCSCYERTNTVWAPIALHMLVNAMALRT